MQPDYRHTTVRLFNGTLTQIPNAERRRIAHKSAAPICMTSAVISRWNVCVCVYTCVFFSPRAACVHAAMIMRDSLSWKAIWGSKGKPRCSSLKIHPVPYCSHKHREMKVSSRIHACTHTHTHTCTHNTEERGRREAACSPGNYIILLSGHSNTLSSPSSGCSDDNSSDFILTNFPDSLWSAD